MFAQGRGTFWQRSQQDKLFKNAADCPILVLGLRQSSRVFFPIPTSRQNCSPMNLRPKLFPALTDTVAGNGPSSIKAFYRLIFGLYPLQ
jgi:hypothetical protein